MRGYFQADGSWISLQSRGGARDDFQNEICVDPLISEEWDSELEFEGDIQPMGGPDRFRSRRLAGRHA